MKFIGNTNLFQCLHKNHLKKNLLLSSQRGCFTDPQRSLPATPLCRSSTRGRACPDVWLENDTVDTFGSGNPGHGLRYSYYLLVSAL